MNDNAQRLRRAIQAIAAGVLLFVVVPIGLVRVSRFRFGSAHPLDGVQRPWQWSGDDLRDALSAPLRDDVVVNALVRAGLCIVWLALAVIAVSVVRETVHMLRHHGIGAPRLRGLGWSQQIGRWIALGLIAALPISTLSGTAVARIATSPATALAHIATPHQPIVQTAQAAAIASIETRPAAPHDDSNIPPIAQRSPTTRATTPTLHTVERGESVYAIARQLAGGDEARAIEIAEQILDLNLDTDMNDGRRFTTPALIQPGWELQLPTGIAAQPTIEPEPPESDEGHVLDRYVVRTDDTLSKIAAEQLGDADRWREIWEVNRHRSMNDGRTFDDPNLILPGWTLELSSEQSSTGPDEQVTYQPETEEGQPPAERGEPTVEPSVEATIEPTVPIIPATPSGSEAPSSSATTTTTTTTTTPAAPASDTTDTPAKDGEPTDAPSPVRMEHLGFLAAGILAVVGVRRQRALRASAAHTRLPTPPLELSATERRLRQADDGELGARVDVALRAAAHRLLEEPSAAQIGSVRAASDGTLTLRLTKAARVDAPWTATTPTAQTWTLPASVPIELLAEDARRVAQPCVAFGCIGKDVDGNDLLVDFETAGLTVIDESSEHADAIMRAICTALTTTVHAEPAHFHVAALGSSVLLDHPNQQLHATAHDAIAKAATGVAESVDSGRSTFELRARRTGGEVWEPNVLLLGRDDNVSGVDSNRLVRTGTRQATVMVGKSAECENVGLTLCATGNMWTLEGFGEAVSMVPAGLTSEDLAAVSALLEDSAQLATGESGSLFNVDTCSRDSDDVDTVDCVSFTPTPFQLIVSLMGHVGVTDRHGRSCSFERTKAVELVAWLSTHRKVATRTAARTALWELDVRDATFANVVSDARRSLGRLVEPPEGEEWLARTLNESLPLHELVITDADLIAERVAAARNSAPAAAIDVLRPAVELINGLPFAGTSYLWPDADGLMSEMVMLAMTATSELAAHALSMGDIDLVFWSTGQGLQVLPGHEELIGQRMRAHARTGDLAGVRQEWESYERVIISDVWSNGEPAPKLLDLRRQLLSPSEP